MRRGVGIQRADDGFHLAERPRGGFFVVGNQRERAHALVVHTKIFGIRAGNQHFAVVLQKDAQAVGILFQAVGKALIGKVKQRQPALLGRHFRQRRPLLGRGVDAGGVVAAAVQQHHVARLRLRQIGKHAVPIQPVRGGVVVAVIADVDADGFENGVVVGPCGRGNPHVLRGGVAFDKFGGDAQCACAA